MKTMYEIAGDGFMVKILLSEGNDSLLGSIVQGIIDATLAAGESITVSRP